MIEILVVVTIFTSLAGLGLFLAFNSYSGAASRSERDLVVSLLERARSRAINNYEEKAWGVCYLASNYVIFNNSCGGAGNELTPVGANVTVLFSPASVVFSQLSGNTGTGNKTITITQPNHPDSIITINNEGTINW